MVIKKSFPQSLCKISVLFLKTHFRDDTHMVKFSNSVKTKKKEIVNVQYVSSWLSTYWKIKANTETTAGCVLDLPFISAKDKILIDLSSTDSASTGNLL